MSTIKVNNIQSRTGNAISFTSGDTITIPSGATFTNNGTVTGFGDNTPAFIAGLSSQQTISSSTTTTVAFASEILDTDNAYNNSTYTFTVPLNGMYCFNATFQSDSGTTFNNNPHIAVVHRDSSGNPYTSGGGNADGFINYNFTFNGMTHTQFLRCYVGDTVKIQVQQFSGSNLFLYAPRTFFSGYKLIGA